MTEVNRSRNLEAQKEKILSFLETNGPSLPIHISNFLRIDSLLSSAFLADLLSDKEVKISDLRVGNSPVYLLRGQEFQLDKFANFLPGKEREIYHLLKDKGVLRDDKMLPATRVALRSIKDFSFPFEYNEVLYWRHIKINEEQVVEMIESGKVDFSQLPVNYQRKIAPVNISSENNLNSPVEPIVISNVVESPKILPEIQVVSEEKIEEKLEPKQEIEIREETNKEESVETEDKPENLEIFDKKDSENEADKQKEIDGIEETKKKLLDEIKSADKVGKKGKKVKSDFEEIIEEFFKSNNLKVEEIKLKKKEGNGIVKFGSEENIDGEKSRYLCIIKDKKTITETDIMAVLKAGHKVKMPVLLVSSGELNKKAEEWVDYFGEKLMIFRKI